MSLFAMDVKGEAPDLPDSLMPRVALCYLSKSLPDSVNGDIQVVVYVHNIILIISH